MLSFIGNSWNNFFSNLFHCDFSWNGLLNNFSVSLLNFVDNFLKSFILLNNSLNNSCSINSGDNFLFNSCNIFLFSNFNSLFSNNFNISSLFINKPNKNDIFLRLFRWSHDDSSLNLGVWSFGYSRKDFNILWQLLFFSNFGNQRLNGSRLFDYFNIVGHLSLETWNWVYCVLGFAWLFNWLWLWSFSWLVINNCDFTFSILSYNESLFSLHCFSCDFVAASDWSPSNNNINNLFSGDIWNFRVVINLLDNFLNSFSCVLFFRDCNFWLNNWGNKLFRLLGYFSHNNSFIILLEDSLYFIGCLFSFNSDSVFVCVCTLSWNYIWNLTWLNWDLFG